MATLNDLTMVDLNEITDKLDLTTLLQKGSFNVFSQRLLCVYAFIIYGLSMKIDDPLLLFFFQGEYCFLKHAIFYDVFIFTKFK